MNTRNTTLVAAALLATMTAGTALADGPVLSNELRLGAYILNYNAKADDLSGPFVPPGVNLDIKNVTTPYFAYIRRLSPHFALQLAAGVPPKTKTIGKGPATVGSVPFNGQVVSTAKWLAPTVLLNYVFRDESEAWRPYVGAGVNYTHFYDRKSTAAGDAANGGPTAISLTNSIGPAVSVGISWRIQQRWKAYASYDYARVNSEYVGNTAGTLRKTSVKFNPSTLVVSIGFSF
jgi:outer membrane protein